MPVGPFDDLGGDQQSVPQGAIVLESLLIVGDLAGGFAHAFTLHWLICLQVAVWRRPTATAWDWPWYAALARSITQLLACFGSLRVQRISGLPQVL